jgi:diguanylate cyclase (GGDEF)-like protein/PAS domain S-box-containing protein
MNETATESGDRRILTGDEVDIQGVLDSFPQYVMMVDSDHTIVMANKCLYDTFGLRPAEVVGSYCPKAIHNLDIPFEGCPVEEAHETGQSVERELYDEPTDRWMKSAAYLTDLMTQEHKTVYLHVVQDITEKKRADEALTQLRASLEETVALRTEELELANLELQRENLERRRAEARIRQLAYYDTLTGLPNRTSFSDLLSREIDTTDAQGKKLGIALLDLDGFKAVNDTTGHDAGDALLRLVGKRLEEATRANDVAARMGGDEFLFILTEIEDPEALGAIAQRLLDVFAEPFLVDGKQFPVTASVGGALYPDDGTDEITLMKRADLAMYRAKSMGRNQYFRLPVDEPSANSD